MAEKTQRKRPSVKRRATRAVGGPLGLAAQNAKSLAEQLRDQQKTADHLAALKERRTQLDAVAVKAETLVQAYRVLRAQSPTLPTGVIKTARQAVRDLRDRYTDDPLTVRLSAKNIDAPLGPTELVLQQTWTRVATPSANASALAELLGRFAQFRAASAAIRHSCERLVDAARLFPQSAKDLANVADLKERLDEQVETLKGKGLDSDVVQFLRDSVNGVPLEELLGKPSVLEFLRSHKLLPSLTVSFRISTQVKK